MPQLAASFANFTVLIEQAIHSTDRAVIDGLIKQGGVDFCRRLVGKAWRMQQVEHSLALWRGQRACRRGPWTWKRHRRAQPDPPAMDGRA